MQRVQRDARTRRQGARGHRADLPWFEPGRERQGGEDAAVNRHVGGGDARALDSERESVIERERKRRGREVTLTAIKRGGVGVETR